MAKQVNLQDISEEDILQLMGGNSGSTTSRAVPPIKSQNEQTDVLPALPEKPKELTIAQIERQVPSTTENEKSAPVKRKRKTYEETFLSIRNIGSLRKPITISPETHNKLDAIVRIALDGRIPLSNFVDNILLHHIDEYNDEFKALFNSHTQDFLKQ
jgi:hypothetical protein